MDLLQRKYGDQIDEKDTNIFISHGAKRMKQIILDLLDYSRASKSLEGKRSRFK
jgi:signal transduction histidine kinase